MRKFFIRFAVYVLLPIFCGAVIYYIFCPDVYFVKRMDSFLGTHVCHLNMPIYNTFIKLLRFYLMDFTWAFSLMAVVVLSFEELGMYKLILGVFVFEFFMELIQLHPCIRGTFDIFDVGVEVVANILVIYLLSKRRDANEKI